MTSEPHSELSQIDTNTLVLEVRKTNDQRLWTEIFNRIYPDIYKAVVSYAEGQDADEILSNTFLKMYQNIHQYKGTESFIGWVKSIAKNESIDETRRYGNGRTPMDLLEDLLSSEESVERQAEDNEILAFVMSQIALLPEIFREAVLLKLQGFSYTEISEMVGQASGTIKSRVHRGMNQLRELVANQGNRDQDTKSRVIPSVPRD